jgi:hypothetical protein
MIRRALALSLVLAADPALAAERFPWPCTSMEAAKALVHEASGTEFIALTSEQFAFVRGIFVGAPDTPELLPPGDRAMMSILPNGSASVIFVDGILACMPIQFRKERVDLLMAIGKGEVTHAGDAP